jgi:drug/metabolite transporter (DMT)-like permease
MIGEIAALATAASWSLSYVFFTIAVRAIGSISLNRLRLTIALGFLIVAHLVASGTPFPFHAALFRWRWLSLSGIVGFAISDTLLFQALFFLGAHRCSLVMVLVPVISALLAWGIFGEVLKPIQGAAVLLVVGGIALVLWKRDVSKERLSSRSTLLGILCALGAACAQSLRYILSKQGMAGGFPVLSANVIQILAATIAAWAWALISRHDRPTFEKLRHPRARWTTFAGAFTGPFLGVTLSLVALQLAPVGIASTLMALPPVFLLPISRFVFKEPIHLRAVAGTILAVTGVALIFLA